MATALMSRFSYPKVPGDGFWSIVDVTGPASYTQIAGTPPTGGQEVTAADFGLQSLDWVGAMGSDNGQYSVIVMPIPFASGAPLGSVLLLWSLATSGAQAAAGANLSARTVRLLAIGR